MGWENQRGYDALEEMVEAFKKESQNRDIEAEICKHDKNIHFDFHDYRTLNLRYQNKASYLITLVGKEKKTIHYGRVQKVVNEKIYLYPFEGNEEKKLVTNNLIKELFEKVLLE